MWASFFLWRKKVFLVASCLNQLFSCFCVSVPGWRPFVLSARLRGQGKCGVRWSVGSLKAVLASLLLACVVPAQAELVVVVNARSGVAVMTRSEVTNIFFGRHRKFFNGVEAQVADLQDVHPDRARFYRALVGKELPDVNAYWSRALFAGRLQPPPQLRSSEEMLRWVAEHPGGIGYVDLLHADARVRVVFELKP